MDVLRKLNINKLDTPTPMKEDPIQSILGGPKSDHKKFDFNIDVIYIISKIKLQFQEILLNFDPDNTF